VNNSLKNDLKYIYNNNEAIISDSTKVSEESNHMVLFKNT